MSIKWREQLAVGNAVIDDDHKELIKLINEYEEAVAKKDLKILDHAFEGLEKYTHEHFEREENLMSAIHFPERRRHQDVHRQLLYTVREKHDQIREHKNINIAELSEFLRAWLVEHVLKEDMKFKPYLMGHRTD